MIFGRSLWLPFVLLFIAVSFLASGDVWEDPIVTLGASKGLFGEKAQANEYLSYALYYWPDPENPDGPYKPVDGKKNEKLRSMDDSGKLSAFVDAVCKLSSRYGLKDDRQAAMRAGDWLRAWLIAPATRMEPHLKYAQIRPNDSAEGDGGGIIDFYRMPDFLDALQVLKGSPALTGDEWKQVDAWLREYDRWLTTSRQGNHAHSRPNNHYVFYVAQCAALSFFLGQEDEAKKWLKEAFDNMDGHIAPDGSQPQELKRAEAWQYSVYSLQAWGYLVRVGERMGDKEYRYRQTPAGASIQKAADYLLQFRSDPQSWPWTGSKVGSPLPAVFETPPSKGN